jgi:hypothetical protein
MRRLLFLIVLLPVGAFAQSDVDRAAIAQTALDYIEGWYAGDAERMARALHTDLVKRIVETEDGKSVLREMTAAQLIEATGRGGDGRPSPDRRRQDVTVLDVFGNTATVRLDADTWIDCMQLGLFNGEWRIVNVLWERRP